MQSAFKSKKSMAECLANELLLASKGHVREAINLANNFNKFYLKLDQLDNTNHTLHQ